MIRICWNRFSWKNKRGLHQQQTGTIVLLLLTILYKAKKTLLVSGSAGGEKIFTQVAANKKKALWPLFTDRVQLPQGYSHFEEAVYFLPLSKRKSGLILFLTLFNVKKNLTRFVPLVSFYTHWKRQKTRVFLMFSGSIERSMAWHGSRPRWFTRFFEAVNKRLSWYFSMHTNKYMRKVNNRNTRKDVKFVQSQQ